MIAVIIFIVLAFLAVAFGVTVILCGFWELRPRSDYDRIDEVEKDVGIGPPYASEFPQPKKPIKERVW